MRYFSSIATPKTLSAPAVAAATQITLSNLTGLPSSYPYTLVIEPDTVNEEIVSVTSLASGTMVNVSRAQDGSSAVDHSSGVTVKHMVTGRDLQEPQTHIAATTSVHGIADTAALATKTYADSAVSTHSSTTTSVHGIGDTSQLALTANVVGKTNGTVTTAANGSGVVRNQWTSTSDPTGGIDGDVWLKYV